MPAEDERVQIKIAGMLIGPTSENNRDPGLIWNFSFRNKWRRQPIAVTVDDVTFDPIVTVLSDDKPALSKDTWSQTARPIPITKEALPWVFDSRPSMKVFRFTVRYADDESSIVHQLALYSASAKQAIRSHADKIRLGR